MFKFDRGGRVLQQDRDRLGWYLNQVKLPGNVFYNPNRKVWEDVQHGGKNLYNERLTYLDGVEAAARFTERMGGPKFDPMARGFSGMGRVTSIYDALRNYNDSLYKEGAILPERRTPVASGDYTFNELQAEINKLIGSQKQKLGKQGMPVYVGATLPNESHLTARGRALEDVYRTKIPYQRKIETVRERSKEGFAFDQLENLAKILDREQKEGKDFISHKLNKNFKLYSQPRDKIRDDKFSKDYAIQSLGLLKDFSNLNEFLGNTTERQDLSLINILEELGKQKTQNKESHVNLLKNIGKQHTSYEQEKLDQSAREFAQDAYSPIARLEKMQRDLVTNYQKGNPSGEANARQAINKTLTDYGININAPLKDWINKVSPTANLRPNVERVEVLPQEILQSQQQAFNFNPKDISIDKTKDHRKELERDLIKNPNSLGKKAYEAILEREGRAMRDYDSEIGSSLKKMINRLNNKFLRLGQFGSHSHIKASEKAARELQKQYLGHKKSTLEDVAKGQIQNIAEQEKIKHEKLAGIGKERTRDFMDVINDIEALNQKGVDIWLNKQTAKDQSYNQLLKSLDFPEYAMSQLGDYNSNYAKLVGEMHRIKPYQQVNRNLGIQLPNMRGRIVSFNERR